MNLKRFLVGTLLILAPVIAVHSVKQTSWGPILAAPPERHTGDPHAKVVIVEYSDFQCPTCARVEPALHQYLTTYNGKIQLIYKYFPLTRVHQNAMNSAHAAECAAAQKQFWPYHDRLFDTQASWSTLTDPTTSFMAIAQDTKLDIPKFSACYADPTRLAIIEQDAKEGAAREVTGTPTFFLGDERYVGYVFATDGARAIERALRQ
jgi:protein-disulfide isomerase